MMGIPEVDDSGEMIMPFGLGFTVAVARLESVFV